MVRYQIIYNKFVRNFFFIFRTVLSQNTCPFETCITEIGSIVRSWPVTEASERFYADISLRLEAEERGCKRPLIFIMSHLKQSL